MSTYAERQAARAALRAARDAEYRRQVAGSEDAELPAVIGQQASAGAARGGKGASRIGRGRDS